jgi:hypothetical protein
MVWGKALKLSWNFFDVLSKRPQFLTKFLYTIFHGIYGQHFHSQEFKKRAKKESVGWFFFLS